jgi:hypothetical protein
LTKSLQTDNPGSAVGKIVKNQFNFSLQDTKRSLGVWLRMKKKGSGYSSLNFGVPK